MGDSDTEMASGAQLRSLKESIKKSNVTVENNYSKLDRKIKTNSSRTIEIQNDILAIREAVIKHLSYENKSLTDRINNLEKRIIGIERSMNNNSQNSRKNNLEIEGIPSSVNHDSLEETVVNIFNKLPEPINCTKDDFEAVHRISARSNTTIVKAKSRKLIEKVNKSKTSFRDIDFHSIGLHRNTKIFINDNLCPHMKQLAFNCRMLKRENKIADTWNMNGAIKIRLLIGEVRTISRDIDLFREFPYFKFTFDSDFCADAEENDFRGNYDDRLLDSDKEWIDGIFNSVQ